MSEMSYMNRMATQADTFKRSLEFVKSEKEKDKYPRTYIIIEYSDRSKGVDVFNLKALVNQDFREIDMIHIVHPDNTITEFVQSI